MQILKDMGITEYEPRVINQMLEFTYSKLDALLSYKTRELLTRQVLMQRRYTAEAGTRHKIYPVVTSAGNMTDYLSLWSHVFRLCSISSHSTQLRSHSLLQPADFHTDPEVT